MNNQYLGGIEGERHMKAKEYLYNFFNECDKDVKITWKDKGKPYCYTIKRNKYDGAISEVDIPCSSDTSIRPDVLLYKTFKDKFNNEFIEPYIIFEVDVTNPVDENKREKIRWLKENKYPDLRVFELDYDMVARFSNDVNEKMQSGGGKYYSLCIEREINMNQC